MKFFLSFIYFLLAVLTTYAMYTKGLSVQANTYYQEKVYPALEDFESYIDYLSPEFAIKYDKNPIYSAKSTLEHKSFELYFYAYEKKNETPGILVTLNQFNINPSQIDISTLYIKAKFFLGVYPSNDYIVKYQTSHKRSDAKHFINIPFNYEEKDHFSYFTVKDNGKALNFDSISRFEFSYSYDNVNFTPFLNLSSLSSKEDYGYSEDIFDTDQEVFESKAFYGNANRYNILTASDRESIVKTNQSYYKAFNYIMYRYLIITILIVFIITFLIFYRKLIVHWYRLFKNRRKNKTDL